MTSRRVAPLVALCACLAPLLVPGEVVRGQEAPQPAEVAAVEPGSELRVWLVTAGPGDAVWERYGHNAIRVLDTATGRDVSYNWGIFSFDQPNFIGRFLQGRMLYMMAPFQTRRMIDAYANANREVVLQELALTPAQKLALRDFAERNALPENRDYLYQYFTDNCSTRVRDVLDSTLGGLLREEFDAGSTGRSYRFHTRRLTQVDPLIYTGMDALLGTPTDQSLSRWDAMFIPMVLRDEIRELTVAGPDGSITPLVISEEVVAPSTRPLPPSAPPRWFGIYLALGIALGLTFASAATARVRSSAALRWPIATLAFAWNALGGVLGTLLVLLLFTDHTFAYWNENLFLFNPLLLGVAALLPLSRRGEPWSGRARIASLMVSGTALVGLAFQVLPFSVHQNAMFFALALPPHLGITYALHAARQTPRNAARQTPRTEVDRVEG